MMNELKEKSCGSVNGFCMTISLDETNSLDESNRSACVVEIEWGDGTRRKWLIRLSYVELKKSLD